MSLQVLCSRSEIENAREVLKGRGASALESPLFSMLRRFRLRRGIKLGDHIKSWDVLATLEFLEKNVGKTAPILDIGCYASEIIVALHRRGFTNLAGADLNPDIRKMPHSDSIRYETADFMRTKFPDASFEAITSISVIEHGFNGDALLTEMSRLLKKGGYFIASFDYWPEKIDTTGVKFFDMDWKIFSKDEVLEFVEQARKFGMAPVGELKFEQQQAPIECGGKKYTFAWLALKKI